MRLVTWNLKWFPGKTPTPSRADQIAHIDEVRNAIVAMRPDILVLQEVSGEAPVADAVRGIPGYQVSIVSRFKTSTGLIDGQQIAICSRLPAKHVFSETWKKGWAGPPRGFAFAAIDFNGVLVHVYGLHLKSNIGDAQSNTAKREDAIEQLLAHHTKIQELTGKADRTVICGDFNTDILNSQVPSERTFGQLKDAGYWWTFDGMPLDKRITCPANGRYPAASFDHIFVSGFGKPMARTMPEFQGSDHYPVSVDLVFNPL